jgi:hypothetical protein
LAHARKVFREDFFDPVTRIRRGRIYTASQTQPREWFVPRHPAYPNEVWSSLDQQGRLIKSMFTFDPWNPSDTVRKHPTRVTIALGVSDAVTLWKIVWVELISNGEYLFTLQARSFLGVLPELRTENVPESGRDQILERPDKLADAAHRAGVESVIDRCRDVAQVMLGLWLSDKLGDGKIRTLDLGALVEKLRANTEDKTKLIIINTANTLARLHARAKPNEQVKYSSRMLTESDGECGIALVGMLLRELDWAFDG